MSPNQAQAMSRTILLVLCCSARWVAPSGLRRTLLRQWETGRPAPLSQPSPWPSLSSRA